MDYKADVQIDVDALDIEWVEQPSLMAQYCAYSAECRKEMDRAKEQVEICKAKLDRQVRSDPGAFGLKKITEGAVASAIVESAEYQECQQEYIDARYEYDLSVTAVRAIDQKKTALENLVRLHAASYFAGPSVPRNLGTEWKTRQQNKEADSKIKIKRRKKTKEG